MAYSRQSREDLTASEVRSNLASVTANALAEIAKTLVLRSEEHTSELQSRFELVCRLLLEKKKLRNRPSLDSSAAALMMPAANCSVPALEFSTVRVEARRPPYPRARVAMKLPQNCLAPHRN